MKKRKGISRYNYPISRFAFDRRLSVAYEITSYQNHRIKRIRHENTTDALSANHLTMMMMMEVVDAGVEETTAEKIKSPVLKGQVPKCGAL
jgi:hypothetical protein